MAILSDKHMREIPVNMFLKLFSQTISVGMPDALTVSYVTYGLASSCHTRCQFYSQANPKFHLTAGHMIRTCDRCTDFLLIVVLRF